MDLMLGDMGSMGGMDMSSNGMFYDANTSLARLFWYLVAVFSGMTLFLRAVTAFELNCRKRLSRNRSVAHPTRPRNIVSQVWATGTALIREVTYPQLSFLEGRWLRWLSPPPFGRSLLLLSYWAIIVAMLTTGAIIDDAYYWERVGFRAAWISVTQVPLIFLLASKISIIGQLSGSSYERLNWLHRWVSRTLLVSVTVHGGFFLAEWIRADFVQLELEMMPRVKYGLGAWAVLLWTLFSSLVPIRRMAYEFFAPQHVAAAAVFLWLLYVHVPSYATYNIWLSIGIWVFDRIARTCWMLWQNLIIRSAGHRRDSIWFGYDAELRAISGEVTAVTLRDVSFTWKAGQHIYLWLPRLGLIETHPFTISNIPCRTKGIKSNAELIIRAHRGFTRRIHRHALLTLGNEPIVTRAISLGPFGCLPAWSAFETLVLISAGTGCSFTLPILESVIHNSHCVQTVHFLLLLKNKGDCGYYATRIRRVMDLAESSSILLRVRVAVTEVYATESLQLGESMNLKLDSQVDDIPSSEIQYSQGRADLASYIRNAVEGSGGETSVAVCGNNRLTVNVRNCVASLSDQRAVHKGSGAQGIHLYVEEFCF